MQAWWALENSKKKKKLLTGSVFSKIYLYLNISANGLEQRQDE